MALAGLGLPWAPSHLHLKLCAYMIPFHSRTSQPPTRVCLLFLNQSNNSNRTSCLVGSSSGTMGLTLVQHLRAANKHLTLEVRNGNTSQIFDWQTPHFTNSKRDTELSQSRNHLSISLEMCGVSLVSRVTCFTVTPQGWSKGICVHYCHFGAK